MIDVFDQVPTWTDYSNEDPDSKQNIDGMMKYWNQQNNVGGGPLWHNLALGNDLYTGAPMNIESPVLNDLLETETNGYYHIKKV